jgi:hypothetical protein
MSYRQRPDFDQPTAESIQASRRTFVWLLPMIVLQQGAMIFRHEADVATQLFGTLAWASVSIAILWMILGLPVRWLSERDQAVLNDEHNRAITADALRWAIAAMTLIGCAMMIARIWVPLNAGIAIYGLVNGALVVAVVRYGWLNRAEPAEDE